VTGRYEELAAARIEVHLAEPADTATLRAKRKRAKTDRPDARPQRTLLILQAQLHTGTLISDALAQSDNPAGAARHPAPAGPTGRHLRSRAGPDLHAGEVPPGPDLGLSQPTEDLFVRIVGAFTQPVSVVA
jgi:hypothetical protein